MSDYKSFGGMFERRELNHSDPFEMAVNRALGEQMRADDNLCREVWSALANVGWEHKNGDTGFYTLRSAGDLIAAIIGKGDYLDWYCCGPTAQVSERIEVALAAEGWILDPL